VPLRLLLLSLVLLPLSGCYLLQAARGQLDVNARRVPVATVLARPETPPEVARRLALAMRVRDYASRALALPENGSYRSYADLGRPYVVWNVYAAPAFSVEPRTWCFPVAGCVAYRGYFAEAAARGFARRLEARGDDVAVGGVPAYSTLGHFADPLLNTMLAWDDDEIASLVFHELAHQAVYASGDTSFNEGFAMVVEEEGLRRWLVADGRPQSVAMHERRMAAERALAARVAVTRERLRALYASGQPPAALRAAKQAEFAALRADVVARWPGASLLEQPLNNAALLEVSTYGDCVPAFAARLTALRGDLPRFYAEMRALASASAVVRRRACMGA
jgi:predicted aminopeptidase